ncbi:MAG: hypothetical protein FWE71_14830 [Nocardioidaceae bacterium]|nr:hypothetical protein [Nocardioidaceae bacterium]MCL2612417.1 hypothetical protein [Nocardioidaceae bacterium]
MRKIVSAVLAATAAVAALLGLYAGAPATAATSAGGTAVTLKVKGCDGCSITPIWAPTLSTGAYWAGRARVVRGGTVSFPMSRQHTHGLYFVVYDPRSVNTDAETLAVTRYAGARIGSPVNAATAAHTDRGQQCWAGTTDASSTLRLTVDRFAARGVTGTRGYAIRPYFNPAVQPFGHADNLWKGTMGAQDVAFCKS